MCEGHWWSWYSYNYFFYSIHQMQMLWIHPSVDTWHLSINTSEADVLGTLSSLNPTKVAGIDDIGPSILKWCAEPLLRPLHFLFSLSLKSHNLHTHWCTHLITSVVKNLVIKPQLTTTALYHYRVIIIYPKYLNSYEITINNKTVQCPL